MINEAALEAVRRNGSKINMADIYNAMDRVLQAMPLLSLSSAGWTLVHWPLQAILAVAMHGGCPVTQIADLEHCHTLARSLTLIAGT